MPAQVLDVRPFVGLGQAERVFGSFRLNVSPGGNGSRVLMPGDGFALGFDEFLTCQVSVCVDMSDLLGAGTGHSEKLGLASKIRSAAEEARVDPSDLIVAVLASSSRLKLAEVVERIPIAEADKLVDGFALTAGPVRPRPMQAPFGGCTISVALCLARELDNSEPLRPWRRGTWLARSSFRLSTRESTIGFTPIPLTDDDRKRMGLPKGTLRYVEVDSPLLPTADGADLRLWVDEELLALLAKYPTSPAALNLQRQLFIDALHGILLKSLQDDGFTDMGDSELSGTLLGRVLVAAGGVGGSGGKAADLSEPLELLRTDPSKLLARLESRVSKLKEGWKQALVFDEAEEQE